MPLGDRLRVGFREGVRGLKGRSRSRSRPTTPETSTPLSPLSSTSTANISSGCPGNNTHGALSAQTTNTDPDHGAQTPASVQKATPTTIIITPSVSGPNSGADPQDAASSSIKKSLWEQAIEKLSPDDQIAFDFNNPDKLNTLSEVIKAVEVKKEECIKKQWKFKKKNGEVVVLRDCAEKLLGHLKKYSVIGDLASKCAPSSGVALAWAGFRFLLQIATNDIETMANIFTTLEYITQTLNRCAIYESLHASLFGQFESVKALVAALPDLYASILAYLCSSKRYFSQNTTIRILDGGLSPYIETFQPLTDQIKNQEARVEKDARVATEEFQHSAVLKAERQNSEQQRDLLCVLKEIQPPISQIGLEVIEIHEQIQAGFEDQARRTQKLRDDLEEEKQRKRRFEILRWLSEITFEDHHSFACKNRLDGTGKWLLQKPGFIEWRDSPSSSILWLHGIAGAGKTKLASLVIDTFQDNIQGGGTLAYFYCNYKENDRRDPEQILRAIVKQLSTTRSRSSLPKPLVELYEEREESGFRSGRLNLDESKNLIVKLTEGFKQTVISIDALDECEKGTRDSLLGALQYILLKSKSRVKIFVTSRDDDDIVLRLTDLPNIYIRSSDNSSDINNFIETEVERCISERKILRGSVSPALKELIISTLVDGAHGMFLWAHLQIISICKEKTTAAIKSALKKLPRDLTETFSEILSRIEDQTCDSSDLAKRALTFIMCAQRPLHPNELIEALRIKPNIIEWGTSDDDGLTEMTILDVCQNLVVIDASENHQVLRFAHLSVQDFLVERLDPSLGHTQFSEVCLTFLCWPIYMDRNENSKLEEINNHAFVNYSTANWAVHVRLSNNAMKETMVGLEEEFLSSNLAYEIWWDRINAAPDPSELKNYKYDMVLHKQVLDRRGEILGKEHPDTLNTVSYMADSLDELKRYGEAIELYKQVLSSRERVLGKEHPDTLFTASNIAFSLNKLEKHGEAVELHMQILADKERVLGKEHPGTLTTAHNIAHSLSNLGRHEEALELFQKVLAIRERVTGKEDSNTLDSAHYVAYSLDQLTRSDEALELYKQVLATRKKVLGNDHPNTLLTASNMAFTLGNRGKHGEALELYKKTLAEKERIFGKEHPETLHTIHNISYSLNNLGKHEDALELLEQALATRETTMGKEHPDILSTTHHIAYSLSKLGRYRECIELYKQALAGREKVLGKEHPDTFLTVSNMALCLNNLGKHGEALGLHMQILADKERVLGKEHPGTLTTAHNIAHSLSNLGRHEEALELFQKVLATRERIAGKEHPSTLATTIYLAYSLESLKRYDEALELHRQVLATRERVLGKDHPDTLDTSFRTALCLGKLERDGESLELYKQVLARREKILGKEHPDTVGAANNVLCPLEKLENSKIPTITTPVEA